MSLFDGIRAAASTAAPPAPAAAAHRPFRTFAPRNAQLRASSLPEAKKARTFGGGGGDDLMRTLTDLDAFIVPETRMAFPSRGGSGGGGTAAAIAEYAPRPFDELGNLGWDVSIKTSATFSATRPFALPCSSANDSSTAGLAVCCCDAQRATRLRGVCRAAALRDAARIFVFPAQPLPRAVVECMAKQRLPLAAAESKASSNASAVGKAKAAAVKKAGEESAAAGFAARAKQQLLRAQQQQPPSLMLLRRLKWSNALSSLYFAWRRAPAASAFYVVDSSPDAHYSAHFCAPWVATTTAAEEEEDAAERPVTALLLLSTRRARVLRSLLEQSGVAHTVLGDGTVEATQGEGDGEAKLQRGDSEKAAAEEGGATPRGTNGGASGVLIVVRGSAAAHGLYNVLTNFVRDPPIAFGGSWAKEDVPQLLARSSFDHAGRHFARASLSTYVTIEHGVSTRRHALEVRGYVLPSALREICELLGPGGGASTEATASESRRVRARRERASEEGKESSPSAAEAGAGAGAGAAESAAPASPSRRVQGGREHLYDAVLLGDERTLLFNMLNPAARSAARSASPGALARATVRAKCLVGLACWRELDVEEGGDAREISAEIDDHGYGSMRTSTAPAYVFTSELRSVRAHDAPGRAR